MYQKTKAYVLDRQNVVNKHNLYIHGKNLSIYIKLYMMFTKNGKMNF